MIAARSRAVAASISHAAPRSPSACAAPARCGSPFSAAVARLPRPTCRSHPGRERLVCRSMVGECRAQSLSYSCGRARYALAQDRRRGSRSCSRPERTAPIGPARSIPDFLPSDLGNGRSSGRCLFAAADCRLEDQHNKGQQTCGLGRGPKARAIAGPPPFRQARCTAVLATFGECRQSRVQESRGPGFGDQLQAGIENLSQISDILSRIEDFGGRHGLPAMAVFNLQLACDEMLTNILSYGFPDARPRTSTFQSPSDRI